MFGYCGWRRRYVSDDVACERAVGFGDVHVHLYTGPWLPDIKAGVVSARKT